jgi:hypothetical protein
MTPPTTSPDSSPRSPSSHPPSPKRKADASNTTASNRPVKRRASKACQCCRARKVRCNVVEHGAPCTNCRLDEVPCIVTESRRRKYVSLFYFSRQPRSRELSDQRENVTNISQEAPIPQPQAHRRGDRRQPCPGAHADAAPAPALLFCRRGACERQCEPHRYLEWEWELPRRGPLGQLCRSGRGDGKFPRPTWFVYDSHFFGLISRFWLWESSADNHQTTTKCPTSTNPPPQVSSP